MDRAAASRCSKLSSTSSSSLSRRCLCSTSASGVAPLSFNSSVCAMAGNTSSGSLMRERGTNQAPSAKAAASWVAASMARRVLPTPPVPVSVSSRTSSRRSCAPTSATSRSRPRMGVGWSGRWCGAGAVCVLDTALSRAEARKEMRPSSPGPGAVASKRTGARCGIILALRR